jgi:hypothetical protein
MRVALLVHRLKRSLSKQQTPAPKNEGLMIEALEQRRRMLYALRYVQYHSGVYQDRAPLATTPREGQRGRPHCHGIGKPSAQSQATQPGLEVPEGGSAMSGDNGPIPPIADPLRTAQYRPALSPMGYCR